MRISDWSSDVCSSDLSRPLPSRHLLLQPLPDPRQIFLRALRSARSPGRALPRAESTSPGSRVRAGAGASPRRMSIRLSDRRLDPRRSEEHTYELQALMRTSYADFCLKKKKIKA